MVPKSVIEPMNSSKNKLNSKINWFFNLKPNAHLEGAQIIFKKIYIGLDYSIEVLKNVFYLHRNQETK